MKFKDADLIGLPFRIAVGKKGLAEGVVEVKKRNGTEVRKMKIDEVWLAWTEDPADDLAARLREGHARALRGLQAVSAKLQEMRAERPEGGRVDVLARHLDSLLGFFGASATQTTRAALDYLARGHPSKPKIRYATCWTR